MRHRGLRSVRVRVRRLIVAGEFREVVHVRLHHCRHYCVVRVPRGLMGQIRVQVVLVLEECRMRHSHLLG